VNSQSPLPPHHSTYRSGITVPTLFDTYQLSISIFMDRREENREREGRREKEGEKGRGERKGIKEGDKEKRSKDMIHHLFA
jgi:hypothetical protein